VNKSHEGEEGNEDNETISELERQLDIAKPKIYK